MSDKYKIPEEGKSIFADEALPPEPVFTSEDTRPVSPEILCKPLASDYSNEVIGGDCE